MTDKQQPALFDPDLIGPDGLERDCPSCKGSGRRFVESAGEWVTCRNCRGTGRARIPY